LVAAAVVGLGALAFAAGAQACSCAQTSPSEAMREADAAIVGELVKVAPRSRLMADYRYRVQRVYKRAGGIRRGRVISVRSPRQSVACGLPTRIGRRYGVLLLRGKGRWASGLCGVFRPSALVGGRFDCAS
jgi:hypothetical protein